MNRDLRIRMLLEAGDRFSKPLRDLSTGGSKAAAAMKATNEQLKQIDRAQSDIRSFRSLQSGLSDTTLKLTEARERVASLRAQIAATDAPTAKLTKSFDKAERMLAGLESTERRQGQALTDLELRLQVAGVAANDLAGHERRLGREALKLNRTLRDQEQGLERIADRQRRIGAARQMLERSQEQGARLAISGGVMAGAGIAAVSPLRAMAGDAVEFESAMADVRKSVDGLDTPKAFRAMGDDILDLSTRIPMAAEGIAAIVAAAGQAKIPRKELLTFAEDAAKMGIAFEMTGDEAGGTMAKWRTAFGLGRQEVLKLANQVNLLGNKGAKTLAVTDIVTRIGPLGKVAGLASGEIAALGATLNSMGVENEVAATGIKNLMLALTKGKAATKAQSEAYKALGLDSVAVAKRMQRDATGTIDDVMQRLGRLPKEQQAGMMTELFGSESVGAIAPLLTQLGKLREFLGLVNDPKQYGGSMDAEYASRAATTANQLTLAESNYKALKITIGNELLPTVNEMAKGMGGWLRSLREYSKANPGVVAGLVKIVAGFGALAFGVGSLKVLAGGVMGAIAPFRALAALFNTTLSASLFKFARVLVMPLRFLPLLGRGAMMLATTVARAGLMLLTNPMILALLAIAAVIGVAGYLIWKNMDKIRGAFNAGLAYLSGIATKFHEFGANIISGIVSGITSRLSQLKRAVVGAASSVANWFKQKLGIRSPSRVFVGFGSYMMQGLDRGIDRTADLPIRRVAAVSRGLTGAFAAGATMAATASLAATTPTLHRSSGVRSAGAAVRSSASPAPVTINIYAAPGESPRSIAQEVERILAERDRRASAVRRSSFRDDPDGADV